MKTEIAQYILSLRAAASMTHRAEDRGLYETYLAEAAVLLTLVETDAPLTSIQDAERCLAEGETMLRLKTASNPAVKFAPLRCAGTALKRSPLPSR